MKKFPIGSIVRNINTDDKANIRRKGIVVGYWDGGNGLCLEVRLEVEKYEEKAKAFLAYKFEPVTEREE